MTEKEKGRRLPWFGFPMLWPDIKKYKAMFTGMIVTGLAFSLIDAFYPLFTQYAINHFVAENTLDTMGWFIGLFLFVLAGQCVINYVNVVMCSKMELFIDRDLRNRAFAHLQEVSLSYYNQNNVGYIHARVMSDTGKIGEMVSWNFMEVVWWGSYMLFAIIVMLFVDIRMSAWLMLLVPVAIIIVVSFQRKLLVLNREVREINSVITADINEGITGVRSIKTMAIEGKMADEFKADTEKMYKKSVRTTHHSALFTSTMALISSVALALVLWRGGNLTRDGLAAIGTLSIFMSYALSMLEPITYIVQSITRIIAVGVNIERYTALMNTTGEVFDSKEVIEKYGDAFHPKYENWEELKGDVEFKNVAFKYPDGEEIILKNFNLSVPQGRSVAIVGETGAGKSTLVNLVCRFFEPTEGQVLIDGKDIRSRSLKWLHSNIGYVLQTPHLFSGTLRDNLKYGKEDASDEEIIHALELTGADKILDKLNSGLNTDLGEGGDFLSVGEKQLLSIARALLADPRILILDEATSSVDSVTEHAIQKAISTVTRGRTSFIIAHRLSTIVGADMILVVSDGAIVERGNHKELMRKKGEYYKLYTRQFEDLATENVVKGAGLLI